MADSPMPDMSDLFLTSETRAYLIVNLSCLQTEQIDFENLILLIIIYGACINAD